VQRQRLGKACQVTPAINNTDDLNRVDGTFLGVRMSLVEDQLVPLDEDPHRGLDVTASQPEARMSRKRGGSSLQRSKDPFGCFGIIQPNDFEDVEEILARPRPPQKRGLH
jgi:hypothetical protein